MSIRHGTNLGSYEISKLRCGRSGEDLPHLRISCYLTPLLGADFIVTWIQNYRYCRVTGDPSRTEPPIGTDDQRSGSCCSRLFIAAPLESNDAMSRRSRTRLFQAWQRLIYEVAMHTTSRRWRASSAGLITDCLIPIASWPGLTRPAAQDRSGCAGAARRRSIGEDDRSSPATTQ